MMTSPAAATVASDPAEGILQVLRSSDQPLTLAQIQKQYSGPKIPKKRFQEIVEEKLLEGALFTCSPSGKSPRYWVHDEFQQVGERLEQELAEKDRTEPELTKAVVAALGKVTTPKAVKDVLA